MKTDMFDLGKGGIGWKAAMNEAERCGVYCGLDNAENLKLRLLAEELINLMKASVGDFSGRFWVEKDEKDVYEVHVEADVPINLAERDRLFESEKTSGKEKKGLVETIKGIWREYIDTQGIALKDPSVMTLQNIQILGMDVPTYPMAVGSFSLSDYIVNNAPNSEEKDELEKFIVHSIADDIKVSANANHAALVAVKKFGDISYE